MKNNPVLALMISMLIFSMMHSCQPPQPTAGESDVEVTIKLKSITQNGNYHLDMKDSKGQEAVDDLWTEFKKKAGEGGTIIWKSKFLFSQIESIDSIYSEKADTEIFKEGVTKTGKKKFKLELPLDIPPPGDTIEEKYYIDYTPKGSDKVITIDPYIRITD